MLRFPAGGYVSALGVASTAIAALGVSWTDCAECLFGAANSSVSAACVSRETTLARFFGGAVVDSSVDFAERFFGPIGSADAASAASAWCFFCDE